MKKPRKTMATPDEALAEVRRARKRSGWIPPDRHYHTTTPDLSALGRDKLVEMAEEVLYPVQLAAFRAANAGIGMHEYALSVGRPPGQCRTDLQRAILRLEVHAWWTHLL